MMLESLSFGPFRIESHQLWRGEQALPLRPKALAVLRYLASQPERLVSQAELLSAVWPDTVVTSTALKVCIREIRAVLGERAQRPHYIETLGQRGYRFIAPVASDEFGDSRSLSSPAPMAGPQGSSSPPQPAVLRPQPSLLAGREPELAQLQQSWETVRSGERQVVLVTGEAGIGKTALVTGFVGQLQETQPVLLARGQCVERYGAGEAYLPMLEAVGRLCQETQSLSGWLRRFAPSWLLQLPALVAVAERETLQRQVGGLPPERMLGELAEAVEILTAEQPLVLLLEDLHWSDPSTLELVSYLAQRQERARLLILGTYRVAEAAQKGRRVKELKQVLQVYGQCQELWLGPLPEAAVTQYVAQQLEREGQATDQGQALAQLLWQRTEGNPLFVVTLLAELLRQGFVAQVTGQWQLRRQGVELSHDIPDSLQQLIEQQVESVSDVAKPVLEVASVVGVQFGTASVEGQCEELVAREHILAAQGVEEWPDGTFSARYTFRHGVYQEVLYAGLSAARRVRLHRQIGERKEAGYGERAVEIAAELAVHFEQGREYSRAVQYRQQAGEAALARRAYQEAEAHCRQGLGLLLTLLTTQECRQHELRLQITLGTVLRSTQGYAAPEVEQRYRRARVLCEEVGETPQFFSTLYGLWAFYYVRGELQTNCCQGPGVELSPCR